MNNQNYIYGLHPVKQTIIAQKYHITKIYLTANYLNSDLIKIIKARKINYEVKGIRFLDDFCSHHQGVIAIIPDWHLLSVDEMIAGINKKTLENKHPFIIILDKITDSQNFGAILRNSAIFGVDGIIIGKHRQISMTPTVAKVSAGGFNYVPIAVTTNLTNAINTLKKNNFWIYATSFSSKTQSFTNIKYNHSVGLVLGNESKGVSPKVLVHSDQEIYVPMLNDAMQSLNVASASAILIHYISTHLT